MKERDGFPLSLIPCEGLRFPLQTERLVDNTIVLRNISDVGWYFKIRSSNSRAYIVKPHSGTLVEHAEASVRVLLRPNRASHSDRLQLVALRVLPDDPPDVRDVWAKRNSSAITQPVSVRFVETVPPNVRIRYYDATVTDDMWERDSASHSGPESNALTQTMAHPSASAAQVALLQIQLQEQQQANSLLEQLQRESSDRATALEKEIRELRLVNKSLLWRGRLYSVGFWFVSFVTVALSVRLFFCK
eukprot:TRINITY_DN32194_c0_g1_i1.p1 TRINITY_DN32194_c0_g1~~TRINITY_DN32194_c0_g1_i1.p1  ORF type:complete len:259 (+),score=34.60 TRINITY_DN32194_c0_g1_i1:40-777(+)